MIVVLGGGGHGSDIVSLLDAVGEVSEIVVLEEGEQDQTRFVDGSVRFASDASSITNDDSVLFIGGVGYPAARRAFVERALAWGWTPRPSTVHPSTEVMYRATIGAGTAVMGFVWVSPNVRLANHVYVGYGVKIGHDVVVEDYASVFPGVFLAGNVTVGEGAMVGANATVLPGVTIGPGAQVGAGAVVTVDVPEGATVTGSPARTRRAT